MATISDRAAHAQNKIWETKNIMIFKSRIGWLWSNVRPESASSGATYRWPTATSDQVVGSRGWDCSQVLGRRAHRSKGWAWVDLNGLHRRREMWERQASHRRAREEGSSHHWAREDSISLLSEWGRAALTAELGRRAALTHLKPTPKIA